jgi:hypothetical protein
MDDHKDNPFNEDGDIDYHKWLRMNALIKKLHDLHYIEHLEQHREQLAWLERRNEMLENLDIIDNVVDMMDEYPEADYIVNKIVRRLYNDKRY